MQGARRKRALLITIAVVVAFVMVLLLPPVQTALVRMVVGGIDGVYFELDRVWAGPWGADLRGLRVSMPGLEIEVPRAEVDLAFWSSTGHLGLDVEEVTATGIRVTLGRPSERDEEASEPFEFSGLAPLAQLPKRVVLRRVVANGTIGVVLTPEIIVDGPWAFEAADLGRRRQAQASLTATLEAARTGEPLAAADLTASLRAEIDSDAAMRRVTADGGLHPVGKTAGGLDTRLMLELAGGSESYHVTLDGTGGHRLVDAAASFDPASRFVDASWQVNVTPGLLAAFARGRALPELSATSNGTARLDLNDHRIDIETSGRFEGRGWVQLDPRLRDVDDLVLDMDLAGSAGAGRLEARRVRVAVTGPAGGELLRMNALQTVTIDLDAWQFIPETWGEPTLRIEVDGFPLRWTRGFDPKTVVEDGTVSASLDVVPVDPGHSRLETHRSIHVESLRLRGGKQAQSSPPFDLTIVPRLELDNGALEARIERAELTDPTGLDIKFIGRAATSREHWPVVTLEGDLAVAVPGLQRLVESLAEVSGGARFELDLQSLVLAIDSASLDVTASDGRSLMTIRFDNETPLNVTLPAMVPDWRSATPQHVDVRFDGLPIDWVSPYIPELDFRGGALFGELHAATGGSLGLTLEPTAPFEIRDLKPVYRGQDFAAGSTVSVEPRLRFDNTALRFALENIRFRTPNRGRLDGEVVLETPHDGRRMVEVSVTLEGEFPSVADRIGRLGALSWRQKAVLDLPSRSVEVTDLEVGLTDAVGTRFLELTTLRPFTVAAQPFAVRVDGGPPEILLATITPLQLQQLFPQVLGFHLEGVLPEGQFVGRAENGGLLLAADKPLVFRDVSVRWQDAALLDRVTVGLQYQVIYSSEGLHARSIEFSTLGPRGTSIGNATLRAIMPLTDRTTIESLHFDMLASLEPLTSQPIFRGLPPLLEGTIGGSVDLAFGDRSTISGSLEMRGAQVEDYGTLPDLDAALDVLSIAGERFEVRVPVRLTSETRGSDLRFDGVVVKGGEDFWFDASLKSDHIVASDVMRLVNLVAPSDPDLYWRNDREPAVSAFRERWSKAAIAQLRERRDQRPFWSDRVLGSATLDIGAVEIAGYAVEGVHGRLEVEPSRIMLDGVEASLFGARFAMEGALGFDQSLELPYDLQFESAFDNLDLGQFFRSVKPDAPPTLEGIFAVRTLATAHGKNLADLGLGTLGSVHLSGRDGVFRGLAGQFGLARKGAKVIGFLTFSKQLKAISRLLGELEALEFETFDLELARETPRRFGISELTVVSPLARIDGSGGVEVEPDVPLALSPLDMTMDLGTRGDMTILFNGLGLLGPEEDENGYRPLTQPVTVGGTVAEPDTSEFYEMLDQAAVDSKGAVGVAIRKANKKLQKAQGAEGR